MTRRELNLAIFEGTADKVLWQPRLETWIGHHAANGTMPERFRGMNHLQIYDELRCSIRYGACAGIERYESREEMVRIVEEHPEHTIVRIRLPQGEITTVYRDVWQNGKRVNQRIEQYPVNSVETLRVATALIERQQFRANPELHRQAAEAVGHRGEPTIFLSSSGFTELIKNWCGLEGTFYLLHDHPTEVEAFLEACDRRDDRLLEAALQLPCRIFNLGDHATNEFTPPPILKKFLLPRWQRIADRLHAAGRFVHTHWDGNSRLMLPFLRESRLDGVEALTLAPMGDMTIEQIKAAVGEDMVVLDLIPAIDFLPHRSLRDMLELTRRLIDTFAPRLILGISDEISPVGEIERVEAVSNLIDQICGLAE